MEKSSAGWREATEWLGPPGGKYHNEKLNLPNGLADEIAKLTEVKSIPIAEFRDLLSGICNESFDAWAFEYLGRSAQPRVLLNRIAREARQLSRSLERLSRIDSEALTGVLTLVLPRVLLRARMNNSTGKLEVGCDRSWLFLNSSVYADLLDGVADCAKVATGKMSPLEAARNLGVRVTIKEGNGSAAHSKTTLSVRNQALLVLIRGLYSLIVDRGLGRLTLWNSPRGGCKGTLPDVLTKLRPYLSEEIPGKLNYRSLHRYLRCAIDEKAAVF